MYVKKRDMMLLLCVVFLAQSTLAESGAWAVNAGGNWSDATNWFNDAVAGGEGATAWFTNAPDASVNRPFVMIDTNLLLNGLNNWVGDGSPFSFVAEQIPGSTAFYAIDAGANEFTDYTSRTVQWKVSLAGTGAVKLSGWGLFLFRKEQLFTGPLYLMNRSSYKGMSYHSYADSAEASMGDLLATEEIHLDYSTFRVCGRFPRPASSGRSWELCAGDSKVRLLEFEGNIESVFSPGQVVTGTHVRDGTYIAFLQDNLTVCLNQPLLDDFSGVLTQTLAFAAAPEWNVTQQIDRLVAASSDSSAIGGIQFQPHISGGYGANSVTLHAGELTGNSSLRVRVDSGYGGWDGRLRLDSAEAFEQAVTLEDTAALVLGDQRAIPMEPTPSAAFWVDASNESSFTKDAAGAVTQWADTRGSGYPSAASWINTPAYTTNALNGLPVVDFGVLGSKKGLAWDREITGIKAVFWVIGSQASGGALLGSKPGHTTDYRRGYDSLSAISTTSANYVIQCVNGLVSYNQLAGDYVAINGREVLLSGSGLSGAYDLVVASVPSQSYKASAFAFDNYDAAGTRFSGGQRLAEVIIYTNTLTTLQIKDTEAYLSKKWFNRDAVGYGAGRINLVTVESGANARIGQAGSQPVEAKYVTHGGNLTVMANSTVTLKADEALPKLTLENGAKAILKTRKIPAAPSLDGNILWLDASRQEDFTFSSGSTISAWRNRGGGSVSAVTPGRVMPERVQDAQDRWVVDLGERDAGCSLMTLTNLMTRSAFIVWFSRAHGTMPLGNLPKGYAGHNEFRTGDFNRKGSSVMLKGALKTAIGGEWFLDGQPIKPTSTPIPTNRLMLTSAVMQGWGGRVSALAGYDFNNTSAKYLYSGGMQLAEVILYDRSLSDGERRDVEAYLTRKWFGTRMAGYADDSGSCDMSEVAVNGSAEVEVRGNAVLRFSKATGAGTLTTSGDMPVIVAELPNSHELNVMAPTATAGVKVLRESTGGAPSVPASGAAMRFDASVASSITPLDSNHYYYAQYWQDQIGGVKAESAYGPASWVPRYKTNAANGLPVIDFERRGRQRAYKWSPRLTNIRTVFWMFKDKGASEGGGWLLGDTTKVSDFIRGSWGTLQGNSSLFDTDLASPAVTNGSIFIDGERCAAASVPKWDYQVASIVTTGDAAADMIAGDRTGHTFNWSGMEVGEVIIYTNALSDAECELTEDYLMNKWLGRRSPRSVCSDTQAVVVAYGSVPLSVTTVDGLAATIAAFKGDGQVVIDGSDVTVLSDAETFAGRVVLRNASTVTLNASLFAATEWIVEAGSVLDLDGQTVTVAGIGGDGSVSNGTLIVSHVTPGLSDAQGALTVDGDMVLADGAVVTVNYNRPDCGLLHVTGSLTVMGAGVVNLDQPIALNAGFSVPLISYGSIVGISHLLTDWSFDGDYSKKTYTFRMERVAETTTIMYKGFAEGMLLLLR